MAEIGQRVRIYPDRLGFVIGHRGNDAIVALDDGGDDWIGPEHVLRVTGAAKPLIRKPGGAIVPLSREGRRVRSRRSYGASRT